MAKPATKRLWDEYVKAYHDFWDYLEQHEELLQKESTLNWLSNVNKVCRIMEECPVVNFSCVRDLIYTMRQFLGEKRFREQEAEWRKRIIMKMKECVQYIISKSEEEEQMTDSEEEELDLGVEVNPTCNFLRLTVTGPVQIKFTRKLKRLRLKQRRLRLLPPRKYKRQVYGQDIFRQQGLILNFNILRTFCNNLGKYTKLKPLHCCNILKRMFRRAFNPEATCIQAAHWYMRAPRDSQQALTRISTWPLHEPVISSYEDRKEALLKRLEDNKISDDSNSTLPPIYTPRITRSGKACFQRNLEELIPPKIAESKHFKRVKEIINSKEFCLYPAVTNPSKKFNWIYYCVMFDPTVSSEAADQGYIGETDRDLVTRWKEHVGSKGKRDDSLVHCNLSLINQYAQQRGKELSDYVAVFALGSTSKEIRKDIEGKLIRELIDGDFSVTNMKYGMNNKRAAKKPNEQIIQNKRPICLKQKRKLKRLALKHYKTRQQKKLFARS